MPTVVNGAIQALSVSQAEQFDPQQVGGCPRRWWFERVERRERPSSTSTDDGLAGHALLATWLRGGALPARFRMLKAVKGALHHLPPRDTPGMLVESRFDGQPHDPDGLARPLDTARTFRLGGVPWDGYVDLRWYAPHARLVTVWDHKFSSDIDTYAKPADSLIRTIQMPIYGLDSLRLWPDAERVKLVHLYISRRGLQSFTRTQEVEKIDLYRRAEQIETLVTQMQEGARATSQEDVPFNRRACHAYTGCPHQSICSANRRNQVHLTEEDKALLEIFGGTGDSASPAVQETQEPGERERLEVRVAPDVDIPLPTASVPAVQPWTGINAGPAPSGVGTPKCANCPHPAHPGVACTGKRGRGACRCGQQEPDGKEQETPAASAGHLPTCVQNDAGKWLCMAGCPVASAAAAIVQGSPPVSSIKREPYAPAVAASEAIGLRLLENDTQAAVLTGARSGPLVVNIQVGFTPETAALLERLFKR